MKSYEIALSFAGEDRTYVEMVARFLQTHSVSFFYDNYDEVDLWGKNLYDHLAEVYSGATRYVVMFISRHYAEKVWTNHERQAAQARALKEKGEYILPVRFDDTEIKGLPHTTHYLDARTHAPDIIAAKILEKLGRPIKLSKASAVPSPHSPTLKGIARLDYSSHNGRFEIGRGDLAFETRWSGAGKQAIYCLSTAPSIRGVALAPKNAHLSSLENVSALDFTSDHQGAELGRFVVYQNMRGFYALLRIESILNASRGDAKYELCFKYWIRSDGGSDFSQEEE